jgi:type I restriction enzyme S subunit
MTMPYLRVANVQDGHLDLSSVTEIRVSKTAARSAMLKRGDVLMTEGGDLDKLGRGTVWNSEIENCLHQNHVFAVRPDRSKLMPEYLALITQSSYARAYFESTGTKTTNLASTSSSKIRDFRIPFVNVGEQRRVVEFLDAETTRIDLLIAARRRQVAGLGELWDSRLAVAIEEQARINGWISLRRLVTSVEQGWSPQCEDAIAQPDEWAVLKTSAVSSGEFAPMEHKRLPADLEPEPRYRVRHGDVLLTRGSGSPDHVGVAALARPGNRRLLLSDLLYRIRIGSNSSPEFVALTLGSKPVRGRMRLLFRGQSGQTIKLRAEDVRSIDIPAVPADFQFKIVADLSAEKAGIRSAIQSIESSLSLLLERRQALITAAVTGGITV